MEKIPKLLLILTFVADPNFYQRVVFFPKLLNSELMVVL